MNMPSHHQSAFFKALAEQEEIDLHVIYLEAVDDSRIKEGWNSEHEHYPYETYMSDDHAPDRIDEVLPDWRMRIHIISGSFSTGIVDLFCRHGVAWCHWSEMPGIRLAELLGYRLSLFRILQPIMLTFKRRDGLRIRNHARGAFGQGLLARRAFRMMGVPNNRIADLYYSLAPLHVMEPSAEIVRFAGGRKVILYVGTLCRRKGIDVLLKSFARLDSPDWCIVLCGLDRGDGAYQTLARKLGILKHVMFLGTYPASRIAEVYAAVDVFVLPSRFDGWGAVLNEAASLGLPCIATDLCGAAWHVVDSGSTGYRIRAGSVRSLTEALRKYVSKPDLCVHHGVASKTRFQREFTAEENVRRMVAALKSWEVQ
jgi:glycosyltransferase involved in cell wall biosynthesis